MRPPALCLADRRAAHGDRRPVLLWGNCQAGALATLLREPLWDNGFELAWAGPVFEMDDAGLARVRETLPRAAAMVTQPIRDEYAIAGCGTAQLAALLPDDGDLVTFPVVYDTSAFPYQVNAHRGDGSRIDAPLTDYHDLRVIVAADRGMSVSDTLQWWPTPSPEVIADNAASSRAELARRESDLDVRVGALIAQPVLFTLSHPTNALLRELAGQVLHRLNIDAQPAEPDRELLGARRAPVERAVVAALGWNPAAVREEWVVEGRTVSQEEVVAVQLDFYRRHPDIAQDARRRYQRRLAVLGL